MAFSRIDLKRRTIESLASESAAAGVAVSVEEVAPLSPVPLEELWDITYRLRRDIVTMIGKAGSGHPGGSLSAADILAVLYFGGILRHDPKHPRWPDRDRFILSKGHAAPALYATLAEAGYFPVEELLTLRQLDSRLQGHTDMTLTPGVEMSSGSLGQGLSFAVGTALAARLDEKDSRVYVLIGDGESDEGQIWEAAMAAAHYKLDNLTAILDRNEQQIDGWTSEVMSLEPVVDKWRAFGWNVIDVNGHSLPDLQSALEQARLVSDRPTILIAHTVKGKGVSLNLAGPEC